MLKENSIMFFVVSYFGCYTLTSLLLLLAATQEYLSVAVRLDINLLLDVSLSAFIFVLVICPQVMGFGAVSAKHLWFMFTCILLSLILLYGAILSWIIADPHQLLRYTP